MQKKSRWVNMEQVLERAKRKYRQHCQNIEVEPDEFRDEGLLEDWAEQRPLYLYQLSKRSPKEIYEELQAIWAGLRRDREMLMAAGVSESEAIEMTEGEYLNQTEREEEWEMFRQQSGLIVRPLSVWEWYRTIGEAR